MLCVLNARLQLIIGCEGCKSTADMKSLEKNLRYNLNRKR